MRIGDFKETYAKDEAVFRSGTVRFWLGVLLAALVVFPFAAGDYLLYMANLAGIAIVGAVGLNILTGAAGQVSLGHAAFVGIGAYTAAILTTRFELPFLVTLPLAGFSSAFFGIIVGAPSMRMKGLYLGIATLAAQVIFEYLFKNWEGLTNGIRGINVPPPTILGFSFNTEFRFYFITLAVVLITVFSARNIFRTRIGRAFIAIRDRDISAQLMGISLFSYKMKAFALSSFLAGVSGCLWVNFIKIVTPEHFPLHESIRYLAMIIVGGLGSIPGTIVGAIVLVGLPELLREFAEFRLLMYGLLLIAMMLIRPEGFVPSDVIKRELHADDEIDAEATA